MDDELKELAKLVLRNEFYMEFSAIVNGYLCALEAIEDNGDWHHEEQLQELTSVFGRDSDYITFTTVLFTLRIKNDDPATWDILPLEKALLKKGESIVNLGDEAVFIWKDPIGWCYNGK